MASRDNSTVAENYFCKYTYEMDPNETYSLAISWFYVQQKFESLTPREEITIRFVTPEGDKVVDDQAIRNASTLNFYTAMLKTQYLLDPQPFN